MLRIFKKGIKTGVVTSRYPEVPEQAPVGFQGKPEFDARRCNACGACAKACPSGAILVNEISGAGYSGLVLRLDYCVFCGVCAEHCPQGAIVLGREFELAAKSRNDLQVQVRVSNFAEGVR